MILKCQYCFTNISATKALIFMEFETQASKIVMDYQNNFRKDSCTNQCTRGVNVRTSARQNLVGELKIAIM